MLQHHILAQYSPQDCQWTSLLPAASVLSMKRPAAKSPSQPMAAEQPRKKRRSGTCSSGERKGPSAYALQKVTIKKQQKQLKKQAAEFKAAGGQILDRKKGNTNSWLWDTILNEGIHQIANKNTSHSALHEIKSNIICNTQQVQTKTKIVAVAVLHFLCCICCVASAVLHLLCCICFVAFAVAFAVCYRFY